MNRTSQRIEQPDPQFYRNLKTTHGNNVKRAAAQYQKTLRREAMTKNKLVFLLRCRKNKLVPVFLKNKVERFFKDQSQQSGQYQQKVDHTKLWLQRRYLTTEITVVNSQLQSYRRQLKALNCRLESAMDPDTYRTFMLTQQKYGSRIYDSEKTRIKAKYNRIGGENQDTLNRILSTDGVTNLTDIDIPKPMLQALSLGPKFALKPKQVSIKDGFNILTEIASYASLAGSAEQSNLIQNEGLLTFQSYMNKNQRLTPVEYYLHHAYTVTKKFTTQHPNIKIIKTDKTNKVAILTNEQYDQKMNELLQDRSTYEPLDKDVSGSIQTKVQKLVDELIVEGVISERQADLLINAAPVPPRLYGSLKDHKPTAPMRPIVTTINSPAQNLCKYVHEILVKVVDTNKYNVKNSAEFRELRRNIRLHPDDVLVSFDVVSLFTSVPLDLAIQSAMKRWNRITKHTDMSKELFKKVLTFCVTDNNYFKYGDNFFRQTSGLPMGGNLSTVLCDFVLEDLFDSVLPKLKHKPTFLKKYVDDVITALPRSCVDGVLRLLNSYHPQIQFTVEIEDNCQLPFLDLLLIREHNSIVTDWYRKKTASDRLISFHSAHPHLTKVNIATELLNRALNLSETRFHRKNIGICKRILRTNHFPEPLINRLVSRTLFKHRNPATDMPTVPQQLVHPQPIEPKKYRKSTYIPGLTERIKKTIKPHIGSLQLGAKPPMKIENLLSKTKSKIPEAVRGGGIYLIPCNNSDHVYIGETKRPLGSRLTEHMRDSRKMIEVKNQTINEIESNTRTRSTICNRSQLTREAMKHLESRAKTSLTAHLTKCDSEFDFLSTKLIHAAPQYRDRKLLEAIYITKYGTKAVNHKRETNNLTPQMIATVHKIVQKNKRNNDDNSTVTHHNPSNSTTSMFPP